MDEQINEKRVTNKLCSYWDSLRGSQKNHPSKEDVVPDDIINIWPYCFIIDIKIENGVPNYQLFYLGEAIKKAFDNELGLDSAGPLVTPNLEAIKEYLDEILENMQPIMYDSEMSMINDETFKFRQCLLPLGPNDDSINAVIGAMSYKRQT